MAESKKKAPTVTWDELNERQQKCLRAIYDRDQGEEAYQRSAWTRGARAQPADEWRWLFYGEYDYGPSPLKRAMQSEGLVDQGTGSTFEALRARGLVLVRSAHATMRGDPSYVHLRLTTAGRKLVRAGIGEVREKKLPAGTLREWHWRALVELYRSGKLVYDDSTGRHFGADRDAATLKWEDGVTTDTIMRLEDYKWGALCAAAWAGWTHFDYVITPFGRQYYAREWARYRALYPDVDAPKPEAEQAEKEGTE